MAAPSFDSERGPAAQRGACMLRTQASRMVAVLLCLSPAALRAQQPPETTGPAIPSDVKEPKTSDFTIYGRLNVSFDYGSQGFGGVTCNNPNSCGAIGNTPQGVTHWIPDVASNLSRFGARGYRTFAPGWQGVFQIEAEVAAAAVPGAKNNGNNDTINPGNNAVSGTLGSRDTFVGVVTPVGAIKLGKGDTPYKRSTADFDVLADTPADYNSIMGNTGGDNRTEFDARFPHAIWYESPGFVGLHVSAMWSPGQNHFTDNIGFATGDTVCAGGNSGPCNDGSFGDGYSIAVQWEGMGLKVIGSYEMHKATNRTGDAGQTTPSGVSAVGTGDESAAKIGAKYRIALSGTTIAGIYEDMRRRDAMPWNERQRSGYFFSILQKIGPTSDLMASLTHANATPGDPTSGPVDNAATMFGVGARYFFDPKATVYLAYAYLTNGTGAHYALGPGGHGVTWDCKDGSGPGSFTDSTGAPIGLEKNGTGCFLGTTIQAFSLGMTYDF